MFTTQRAAENVLSDERLDRKVVSGLAYRKLIARLNRIKLTVAGSTIVRVRVCEGYSQDSLELRIPRLLCPLRLLWPALVNLAHAGDGPFPVGASRRVIQ